MIACFYAHASLYRHKHSPIHTDLYVESSEECKRLSVWCVSQIGTIGHLAQEAVIDAETESLLIAAVPPLLDLKKMVADRLQASRGVVGKLISFWNSSDYLEQSGFAQKRVQAAIDALVFRVQVDTRIDVQKVREKCLLLPAMDKKLDDLLGLAKESKDKLDQMLELSAKKSAKEQAAIRKDSSMAEYTIPLSKIKRNPEPIAGGATSQVFKGEYGRSQVAIKVMILQGTDREKRMRMQRGFASEVALLTRLRHPNVVHIYGIIDEDLTCLQLVMELASKGDLRDYLKANVLQAPLQLDLCNQIAQGMEYLHSKKVAHRDFKSLNVLMFISEGRAMPKISDFGLSKMDEGFTATAASLAATKEANGPLGTPAWSAPEVLKQDRSTDPFRSDIWSYGVVVWEVTTGKMPWEGESIMVILNEVGNNGRALQMPQDSAPALITVFNKCCAWIRRKESPSMRSRKFCSLRWIRPRHRALPVCLCNRCGKTAASK